MPPHALGRVVLQPVVQPLVVAKVESLLLEVPFEIPICLGHEEEVRVRLLTAQIASTQYSVDGPRTGRWPHVRSNTSFSGSIAMSQRTPSHWPAISESVSTTA